MKVYLPDNGNFGVKCFNKSTPVQNWSTMASNGANNPIENPCEICRVIENCEECCSFCQAIEMQSRQSCPDCSNDILLDESTMRIFHDNGSHGRTRMPKSSKKDHKSKQRTENGSEANIGKNSHFLPVSLFDRIRRLTLRSLLTPRKGITRSRLWTRIRTGSQRLKGSKRIARTRNYLKEPISRIFLPTGSVPEENHEIRDYSEQYLNSPTKNGKEESLAVVNREALNKVQQLDSNQTSGEIRSSETKAIYSKTNKQSMLAIPSNTNKVYTPPELLNNTTATKSVLPTERHKQPKSNEPTAVPSIKPFFISHPTKANNMDNGEVRITELNGQVLSMSSDSGECVVTI